MFHVQEDGVRDLCEEGGELSQDTEALRELISLSSSQLEEMENSGGDGSEEEDKDEGLFVTGSEHAQLVRSKDAWSALSPPPADENNVAGSTRKRTHPGY